MLRFTALISTIALSAPAHALEGNGRAGLIWPGAAPLEGGEASVGGGVVVDRTQGEEATAHPAGSLDLIWGSASGFAAEVQSGYGDGLSMSAVGARYLGWTWERASLAPWIGATVIGPAENTGWDVMVAPGVAAEFGGERLRGDVSAPLVGVVLRGQESVVIPAALLGEAGVTWRVGDGAGLRLGFGPLMPTLRWRHELDGFFYEVGAASVGEGFYQARVGWRL